MTPRKASRIHIPPAGVSERRLPSSAHPPSTTNGADPRPGSLSSPITDDGTAWGDGIRADDAAVTTGAVCLVALPLLVVCALAWSGAWPWWSA